MVWQVGEYKSSSASPTMIRFLDIFGIVVQSALLPTIVSAPPRLRSARISALSHIAAYTVS